MQTLFGSAWTPARSEWYQKLLELPIQPATEPVQSFQNREHFVTRLGLTLPSSETTSAMKELFLVSDLRNQTDTVYLYERQISGTLHPQYFPFSLNERKPLLRNPFQPVSESFDSLLDTSSGFLWKIKGFQEWLTGFPEAMQKEGEQIPYSLF